MSTTFQLRELKGAATGHWRLDSAQGSSSPVSGLPVVSVQGGAALGQVQAPGGQTVLWAKLLGFGGVPVAGAAPVRLVADEVPRGLPVPVTQEQVAEQIAAALEAVTPAASPSSVLIAYAATGAAPTTPTAMAFDSYVEDSHADGDMEIDGEGNLLINADGEYVIALEVKAGSATADYTGGLVRFTVGGSALPSQSFVNWADAKFTVAAQPSGPDSWESTYVMPQSAFVAGNVVTATFYPATDGTVSFGNFMLYARRVG